MKRIITGLIVGCGWLLLLLSGSLSVFSLVISLVGAITVNEYLKITLTPQDQKYKSAVIATSILPLLAAYSSQQPNTVAASIFVSLLILICITLKEYKTLQSPFDFLSKSGFGVLYISFCMAHIILIMALPQGYLWLLLLTAITIASDTGAFYIGSKFGKTKLCSTISPGKTIEGFLGGLLSGILAAIGVALYFTQQQSVVKIILIAAILSCIGVIGDLTESIIKRSTGVKDSGTILPGHGGVLDRIDSLLLTAPTLFYLLYTGWLSP